MCHVGIVTGVLHDTRRGRSRIDSRLGERKGGVLPARQRDLYRIGEYTGEQSGVSRLGRSRRAGACGPPFSEWPVFFLHAHAYKTQMAPRHAGTQ
jgi:guanyl-specific ribonuclease Sa